MDNAVKITPETGKRMLAWALKHLAEKREAINAINVFPVKDKDTGSNMLSGVRGALRKVSGEEYPDSENGRASFYADLQKGLLRSAQGNAGVISAAWLQKFCRCIFTDGECAPEKFVEALEKGKDGACSAV